MTIRNAAKAVVLNNEKILLVKYNSEITGECYTLPGGGQEQYETMKEAVIRECLEETGHTVNPEDFVAIYEEIYSGDIREKYPEFAHKILHIFRASLKSKKALKPTETDLAQVVIEWVNIKDISKIKILPKIIGDNIEKLIYSKEILDLGTHFIDIKKL